MQVPSYPGGTILLLIFNNFSELWKHGWIRPRIRHGWIWTRWLIAIAITIILALILTIAITIAII